MKSYSKMKKLKTRLIITKTQAKNFDLELLRLHPNRGHGYSELALGNSPTGRPVSAKNQV